jgi:hypothetical protein
LSTTTRLNRKIEDEGSRGYHLHYGGSFRRWCHGRLGGEEVSAGCDGEGKWLVALFMPLGLALLKLPTADEHLLCSFLYRQQSGRFLAELVASNENGVLILRSSTSAVLIINLVRDLSIHTVSGIEADRHRNLFRRIFSGRGSHCR